MRRSIADLADPAALCCDCVVHRFLVRGNDRSVGPRAGEVNRRILPLDPDHRATIDHLGGVLPYRDRGTGTDVALHAGGKAGTCILALGLTFGPRARLGLAVFSPEGKPLAVCRFEQRTQLAGRTGQRLVADINILQTLRVRRQSAPTVPPWPRGVGREEHRCVDWGN